MNKKGGKDIKVTTRGQFECLVSLMEQNPDVARGYQHSKSRQEFKEVWKEISIKLNSLGGPSRTEEEWQKVWTDYKLKIKKKLGHNKREVNATGGGPNRMATFSPLEEKVIALLSLEKAVHGGGNVFGFSRSNPAQQNSTETVYGEGSVEPSVPPTSEETPEVPSRPLGTSTPLPPSDETLERDIDNLINTPRNLYTSRQNASTSRPTPRENFRASRQKLLESQTKDLKEVSNNLKEVTKYIRKLSKIQEEKLAFLKKESVEKHKYRKENLLLRTREIEYKEQMLALEQQKFSFQKINKMEP